MIFCYGGSSNQTKQTGDEEIGFPCGNKMKLEQYLILCAHIQLQTEYNLNVKAKHWNY